MKNFEMTEEEYEERSMSYEGLCTLCGAEAYSVEPDVRKYVCAECGERGVYGLEELMMMGNLTFCEEN
jgi:predicted RNA-binding Zn-ribbon protein involved in translation (DUF1610 family)